MIIIKNDVSIYFKANSKIYDIKSLNNMNRIHDNEVNNISEWNLIHDIINPSLNK